MHDYLLTDSKSLLFYILESTRQLPPLLLVEIVRTGTCSYVHVMVA